MQRKREAEDGHEENSLGKRSFISQTRRWKINILRIDKQAQDKRNSKRQTRRWKNTSDNWTSILKTLEVQDARLDSNQVHTNIHKDPTAEQDSWGQNKF